MTEGMAILRISFYIVRLEFRNNGIENILCIRDFGGLIRLKHHKLILVSLNTRCGIYKKME